MAPRPAMVKSLGVPSGPPERAARCHWGRLSIIATWKTTSRERPSRTGIAEIHSTNLKRLSKIELAADDPTDAAGDELVSAILSGWGRLESFVHFLSA